MARGHPVKQPPRARRVTMDERALRQAAISRIKAKDIDTAAGYLLAMRRLHCPDCKVAITLPVTGTLDEMTAAYATHEIVCPEHVLFR
jgi:hypothetical protein